MDCADADGVSIATWTATPTNGVNERLANFGKWNCSPELVDPIILAQPAALVLLCHVEYTHTDALPTRNNYGTSPRRRIHIELFCTRAFTFCNTSGAPCAGAGTRHLHHQRKLVPRVV